MLSDEAKKILVKETVTLLMKEDPNWDQGLEDLSKEDVMQIMKNVTEVYADCRVLTLSWKLVYDESEETIERTVKAAMILNPIK